MHKYTHTHTRLRSKWTHVTRVQTAIQYQKRMWETVWENKNHSLLSSLTHRTGYQESMPTHQGTLTTSQVSVLHNQHF